ncbi:biotin/lipoyl-containing protein [Stappia sp. ES.058]|uniref:biotin/lipoyl-containing protein n=1 Tax=Stappia sp. ES.058 TaxID=1881061 RepID=UPI0008799351|nr:biotin/lipoyl-containing protein [Stappia sp. ES.058]SDU17911.1 pyruvate dehydrogenase E2 component (dihydrolipoamide acetyltransferase)/2-oxoglutarate dehydrogenase E2 component (dihydrolipoamide succinyltransferase) [Stappia sp. ES.058]
MPHDVIMPALGMAQDSGLIVSWLKSPGDAVKAGDALMEVETDKATMEVEAQADGFLTRVTAAAGDNVPVGNVVAVIAETADAEEDEADPAAQPEAVEEPPNESASTDMPEGKSVIMPALGMAQDTGLLVSWQKAPGDAVAADDVLFEVETDKSTMEVPAGHDGFIAALLAEAGDSVPVGESVAIISAEKPADPQRRSAAAAAKPAAASPASGTRAQEAPPAKATAPVKPTPAPVKVAAVEGVILASPKARRLALEEGLNLSRLVEAGHPQPFHVRDLETLRTMPARDAATAASSGETAARHLSARVSSDGLARFLAWAREETDRSADATTLLAGFAKASLSAVEGHADPVVLVETMYGSARFPAPAQDDEYTASEEADLIVRDLRASSLSGLRMGAEAAPVLTLVQDGETLTLTLECAPGDLDARAAIALVSEFAGRLENPLRHLL